MMAPHARRGSGECEVPPLEIGVQAIQLSPYRAGLAGRHRTRLPVSPAFPTCSCPLWLSPSGESMTQESPFELLLTVSRIQHRVPRRTVSLHPAQASQRPCEGPVSSHTTCWLHDTEQKSMPLRGREHQWNEATDICNTFCTDSSVVLVPRHRREVSPLARGVMLPTGATPIHPITGWPSLFPTPIPAPPSVGLTAFLPFSEGAIRAYHVPHEYHG